MGDPITGADVPVAFIAGLVSFLSPCVLPLVPGYLSVITGVSPNEIGDEDWRRILVPSLLFIASFSTIFILLGLGGDRRSAVRSARIRTRSPTSARCS